MLIKCRGEQETPRSLHNEFINIMGINQKDASGSLPYIIGTTELISALTEIGSTLNWECYSHCSLGSPYHCGLLSTMARLRSLRLAS